MDSDNDEGSNQLDTSYSLEGSNTSWHGGCEEWRPIPPHATHLYILIYWKQLMKWITYKATITILLIYILMEGIFHGARSAATWIYYMYQSKHTRQKSLKKYMKSWRSRLARLNDIFDSYIKTDYFHILFIFYCFMFIYSIIIFMYYIMGNKEYGLLILIFILFKKIQIFWYFV